MSLLHDVPRKNMALADAAKKKKRGMALPVTCPLLPSRPFGCRVPATPWPATPSNVAIDPAGQDEEEKLPRLQKEIQRLPNRLYKGRQLHVTVLFSCRRLPIHLREERKKR
jgi:hypothetical protein